MRAALASLLLAPVLCRAADAPKKPWKDTAEASLVSTNGNSKATTTAAKNLFIYAWTQAHLELEGGALGAKSKGEVTSERYNASEKVAWDWSKRDYLFERFGWDKNRFAGYRNRYDSSVGAGREFLGLERHKLIGEAGFGYISEERITEKAKKFGTARAYSKYELKLSDTANFSQSGEYIHDLEESKNYRLNTETALTAAINSLFSIKASYVWNRVGKPAAGFSRDDTTTAVALIASF